MWTATPKRIFLRVFEKFEMSLFFFRGAIALGEGQASPTTKKIMPSSATGAQTGKLPYSLYEWIKKKDKNNHCCPRYAGAAPPKKNNASFKTVIE